MNVRVKFIVRGKPSYLRWTLEQWFREVSDIIKGEYGIEIDVDIMDSDEDPPVIVFNSEVIFEGLPGEEGYLIEIIKSTLERKLGLKPKI